jgi:uncharacterized Zn ribbon protein
MTKECEICGDEFETDDERDVWCDDCADVENENDESPNGMYENEADDEA